MVDLSFGNLSLGDILYQNDHSSVFHGLHGEFKCLAVLHIQNKSGIVAARKPGIKTVDQVLCIDLGNQACLAPHSTT